jgi:SSS family solute:Na+ symporter
MSPLDWTIVASYFALMLAIGGYYARRNRSAEDFVLGGRTIPTIAAGLSLFATLASTLSYLAIPGEIIAHGPMMLAQIAAYPFILAIVGWGLIPYLMRQEATSAYEMLEGKLGMGIRLAGAGIFVALRIGWMATIMYATSSVVIAPLFNLDPWMIPLVCAGLAIVTMTYASAGGLRAVVATDALQAILMLTGAAATVIVISLRLGGPGEWIPREWPSHWDRLSFSLAPERISLSTMFISTLVWYVCTNGSDQMSIQRFLSTRNASSARRSLAISLGSDTIVTLLLTAAAFALFAYFQRRPEELGAGLTAADNGDKFFTRFILSGMPMGLSGLVVAAILAAAMSSLSSGLNSTSAILERDFLPAIAGRKLKAERAVRRLRWLTLAVGVASVLISIGNTFIEGNLLDRCYKVVNLLTAPLFVLFFLALFVKWATPLGAWCGLIASVATAVGIAYIPKLGISLFWMLPASLSVGIVVGVLASYLTPAQAPKPAPDP